MWPFKQKTYAVRFEFLGDDLETRHRIEQLGGTLAQEIQEGKFERIEKTANGAYIFFITKNPQLCLIEAIGVFERSSVLPQVAHFSVFMSEKWREIWSLSDSQKRLDHLQRKGVFKVPGVEAKPKGSSPNS